MAEPVVVALRTADGRLAEQVGQVVAWWEGRLVVRPPGSPPPPADVHVDSPLERERGDPPWARERGIDVVGGGGAGDGPPGAIALPDGADRLADAIASQLAAVGSRTIGVVAARGGAGASVTAALLARALVDDGRGAALVDLVGGLDHLLGLEEEPGPRWADLDAAAAPFVGRQLVDVLPRWGRVPVLAADARARVDAVPAVLTALREGCAAAVLDLGRARPPVGCESVLVVTTPEPSAVLDARRLVAQALASGATTVRLLLRSLPGVAVDPGEVAEVCGVPSVDLLPYARLMTADLARGVTPGDRRRSRLVRVVRRLAREIVP